MQTHSKESAGAGLGNSAKTIIVATVAAAVVAAALATAAAGQAPAPCANQPQISDATGDGHHNGTDVLSAWFSEAAGRLQAVIQVREGKWTSDHEADNHVGFAFLFGVGGQIRYVRALVPGQLPVQYDYGTWTSAGGFASAGPTSGALVVGTGGTATIDVPAQTSAAAGAVLANPFVLTYDDGPAVPYPPHWVDRGPGGTTPDTAEFGADYVVGSCGASGGGSGGPGQGGISSVTLRAPTKRVGAGRVTVRGSVAPARGGVPVELTASGGGKVTRKLVTGADGSFSARLRLSQTSTVRALASGLRSPTLTVTMVSKTRISVKRLRGGGVLVRGRVSPPVPGRVLLLRTTAYEPSGRTRARKGRFRFRLGHLRRGRYEAVFIPFKDRAERSTSNKGVIR